MGALVGWLAGVTVKEAGLGLLGNIVAGIVGALIGGWLAGVVFNTENAISAFKLSTIVIAFLGAVLLVVEIMMRLSRIRFGAKYRNFAIPDGESNLKK